ncbi:C40 family peptidase, poly gamma glutamate hydrolase [Alkalihalophilus pseudofirmus OF4]|uniref:C40 family peptidase, poly gamma glutamate hydrolase n=1 Tax=Alkalihalophilus pseudofirmus (strain ATCC BAA-2126 / JCM 17055 / OF4) TaxID=398511 RepID=D3G0B2_ALKPO|nr:NlpC/P60 family protein [Alkalihalophilus pseudofirmus]ADC49387.1 C40 family peptidase, poly gamma glutamate hydrolase [Alkalihalophilus pseudofirmus OF4]
MRVLLIIFFLFLSIFIPVSTQAKAIERVDLADVKAGDTLYFTHTKGTYIGNGRFLSKKGLVDIDLTDSYWIDSYVGLKRRSQSGSTMSQSQSMGSTLASRAISLIGTPYNQRGETPHDGFSTGSFVHYVYKDVTGSLLSKIPLRQKEAGTPVKRSELAPGDLVFFQGSSSVISGIYVGNQEFVIATSNGVAKRHLDRDSYYANSYVGAVRYSRDELRLSHPKTYENHEHPAVREAMRYIHTPYVLTGNTLAGFDCSYLIQMAFADGLDVHLPRITYNQWEVGLTVLDGKIDFKRQSLDDLIRPGDAIYFSNTWQPGISHVGIYLGQNYMVHASGDEGETTISYIASYWQERMTGAKRFDDLTLRLDHPVVQKASVLLGTPYVLGADEPETGFDTGSLVQYIYKESVGLDLPRFGSQQILTGVEVTEPETGDLLFFQGSSVIPAVYVGNGQMVVMTQLQGATIIDYKNSDYWAPRYIGARRVL